MRRRLALRHLAARCGISLLFAPALCATAAEQPEAIDYLSRLSLVDLANTEVTSVSKSPQPLSQAPATVYVITHDQILRSGATSLPEALRLAPNLLVSQQGASSYVISARGFGGDTSAQNFSNKLLILIDGRSVYSPLFSGIYADAQDVLLEDIDRIEVISGPGATLWGANAMNGVINIITRSAYLTDGTYVRVGAGNDEQGASVRYGDKVSEEASYRVYGKAFHRDAMELADDSSAHDAWNKAQGGFRVDRSTAQDTLTVQGDLYRATENQLGLGDLLISGADALARWQHRSDRSDLQIQGYYDQTERFSPIGEGAFVLNTYDIQMQQDIAAGSANQVIWGAGERVNDYSITNTATLLFEPENRALTLGNVFAQDTLSLTAALKATLGIKLEDDPYSGWSTLPNFRAAWTFGGAGTAWLAASRAIRSPTPFDDDVVEKFGSIVYLTGNADFKPERVSAYEIGYRAQPTPSISFSIAGFYDRYDDLRTIETAPSTGFLPFRWGNSMQGDTNGIEAWASWQISDWWRLSSGLTTLHKGLEFKAGASGLLGVAQAGDDPTAHAVVNSAMDLGNRATLDVSLRYVGSLPWPALPAYTEMNVRYAWRATKTMEVSLSGMNLLHARHVEYGAPAGEEITRSVLAEVRWRLR